MAEGMEWILDNIKRYDIRILNISIGMDEHTDKGRMEKLVKLVDEAWERGLIVVCAAGNMGPNPMTISPLGARKQVELRLGCLRKAGILGTGGICVRIIPAEDQALMP